MAEVVIGWFGPGDANHPEYGDLWRGALVAVDEENAAGGCNRKPLRLVPAWSESPWKAGILDVTRLVYEQHAWAVIGGVDGTTTHLAVQLALKSFFPLLSPGSTDVSADHANVPWLFSLPPSDDRFADVIAEAVAAAGRDAPFVVAAATDHDSHAALVALRRALAVRRLTATAIVEMGEADPDLTAVARRLASPRPATTVVLARATPAGRLVRELRRAGYHGRVVGGAPLGRAAFARAAGDAAEGVMAPAWIDTRGPQWRRFAAAFEARWGSVPDSAAVEGHDAVRLVAAAVRAAGLNRVRIRDAVRALAPWAGAAGTVEWNVLGRNSPDVVLGRWGGGSLERSRGPGAAGN